MSSLKNLTLTLMSLWVLISCVPQTKQTECSSNEAFNASLRSCVPVIGGPTSFIKIASYQPSYPVSVYRNDSNIIPLEITIDNPYNQDYQIEWERVYYGMPSTFDADTLKTTIVPLSYASELGAHFITAKVIADDEVVDSHTFQITISETPRPVILSQTIEPAAYATVLTPNDSPQEFSFTVDNNSSSLGGAGYNVKWSVSKNGVNLAGMYERDAFASTASNGTNTFYLGTSEPAGYSFIPSVLGVGNYVIKATVGNDLPGETVAEQQWSVTIQHPELPLITSRNLYKTSGSPSYQTTVVAYNGEPYNTAVTYGGNPVNFVPTGQTTKADFCVQVQDPEGSYDGDSKFIRVDYFLDNSTLVYSGYTSNAVGGDKVCLSDAPSIDLSSTVFSNAIPDSAQTHYIVARVYDEATNREYTQTSMLSGLTNPSPTVGMYPIVWNINVKPKNSAPAVVFYAPTSGTPASCTPDSVNPSQVRNCNVNQGEVFTIGLTVTDDFYNSFPSNDDKYSYSFQLRSNGNPVSGTNTSCSKLTSNISSNQDVTGLNDYTGPNFVCRIQVPHYDATYTPLDPDADYEVIATISDISSPFELISKSSVLMTWKLNVTETSTAPVIQAFNPGLGYSITGPGTTIYRDSDNALVTDLPENGVIRFRVEVVDNEGDDFQLTVKKYTCVEDISEATPTTCTSTSFPLHTSTISNNKGNGAYRYEFTWLPTSNEDLVGDFSGCVDTPSNCIKRQFFKIEVEEIPHTPSVKQSSSPINAYQNFYNINPAPTLTGTPSPSQGSTVYVMSGMPVTLNAGTISDASLNTAEKTPTYQWYVSKGSGAYTAIPGATNPSLVWTPDNITTDQWTEYVYIKLCYGDGSQVYPVGSSYSRCSSQWTITPWNSWQEASTSEAVSTTQLAVAKAGNYYFTGHYVTSGREIQVKKIELDSSPATFEAYTITSYPFDPLSSADSTAYDLTLLPSTDGTNFLASYLAVADSNPGESYVSFYHGGTGGITWFTPFSDAADTMKVRSQGIGNLALNSGYWYLPFIDSNRAGADYNKVGFLHHTMSPSGVAATYAQNVTYTPLDSTSQLSQIESASYSDKVYVAGIKLVGAGAALYSFDISATPAISHSQAIFSGIGASGFTKIRVSPPTSSNSYVHVLGLDTNGKWWYGRYDSGTLSIQEEFQLSSMATTPTADLINDENGCSICDVRDMQISSVDINGEARIVVSSDQLTSDSYYPYVLRVKYGGGDTTVQCDHSLSTSCVPFYKESLMSGMSFALSETTSTITAGSVGDTSGENNKPLMYGVYPRSGGVDLMLINAKDESINATSADGTNGLYRPALIAD